MTTSREERARELVNKLNKDPQFHADAAIFGAFFDRKKMLDEFQESASKLKAIKTIEPEYEEDGLRRGIEVATPLVDEMLEETGGQVDIATRAHFIGKFAGALYEHRILGAVDQAVEGVVTIEEQTQ